FYKYSTPLGWTGIFSHLLKLWVYRQLTYWCAGTVFGGLQLVRTRPRKPSRGSRKVVDFKQRLTSAHLPAQTAQLNFRRDPPTEFACLPGPLPFRCGNVSRLF